ncbi:cyclophane-forming radical SAM/SPASM peptide maturase GrrM/OscB [Bradyrhizobium yuanmingense]|uniref:cyclophane-forming radical SAM/SPASM peptide maturase GrrM/OscB n=1 Tax=Bradyrhizobium yuanmingense TaxID=108015 RepID=UPI0023B9C1D9|nr:cyclophane-forming radical SAM/SPASM peptide maturase GrrM/OscB [Bradyrhizobium yuanmingense]MDF0492472.1 GRRM system radical SAM/SPASM domain protein [Bradyrhizobium yuanmingense]
MIEPRLIILQPTPYCNINCSYCYLGHRDDKRLMTREVLEALREKVFRRLSPRSAPIVVWHAGEPTAAPIEWYEHAYGRLRDVAPSQTSFAIQSNGIAIDNRWIELFRRTNTNVSLSVDGPQRFHDARRRTRNDKPTWHLAIGALKRLQEAGFDPSVITVLHTDGLHYPEDYYAFYREHRITQISFSVDELEGANKSSSFAGRDFKPALTDFLVAILERAYCDGYPLHIREVERIAQRLAGIELSDNEQVEPWAALVVAADGSVSTFSPEFMEMEAPAYDNFVFGNILEGSFEEFTERPAFLSASRDIADGIEACKKSCRYFLVCGGGSPVNKLSEKRDMKASETDFCRLTTQASADALFGLLSRRTRTDGFRVRTFEGGWNGNVHRHPAAFRF